MKSTHLIAAAAALVGFAAGWVFKPSAAATGGDAETAARQESGTRAARDSKSRVRDDRPLVLRSRGERAAETDADAATKAAHQRFEQTFGDATQRAQRARLNRFVEALGLSAEQEAAMAALLNRRREGFRSLEGSGKTPAESMQLANAAEKKFQEEIHQLLDPEQAEALTALQEREKENDIEARAQRDLADLIGQVDLSADQRDQVLEIYRDLSATRAESKPQGWDLMHEAFDVMGGPHMAVIDDLGDIMDDPDAMRDPAAVQQRLIQVQRAAMEEKINRLGSVLTPGQLAQFRATMEARSSFMENFTPPSTQR
jgi:hypothetical protein